MYVPSRRLRAPRTLRVCYVRMALNELAALANCGMLALGQVDGVRRLRFTPFRTSAERSVILSGAKDLRLARMWETFFRPARGKLFGCGLGKTSP
jgi:hypothetical protein